DDLLEILRATLRVLLRPLDLLLRHPHQPVLDGRVPRGRLLVEIAIPAVSLVVAEGVEEGVHRGGGGTPAVGPERDLALRLVDLVHELLEVLPPRVEEGGLQGEAAA